VYAVIAAPGAVVGPSLFDNDRQWLCSLLASLCITSCVVSLFSIGSISINRYVYICRRLQLPTVSLRYSD